MIYLAKFDPAESACPVLVEAEDVTTAIERVEAETERRPVSLSELPFGLLFCEVEFADAEDDPENPANASRSGVALDPFDVFATWLDTVDEAVEAPPEIAAVAQEGGEGGL